MTVARTASWFDAPSLTAGAELAARVLADDVAVDVRPGGVRVAGPVASMDDVRAVAHGLGLTPDPSALQRLTAVVESSQPDALASWWERVLGGPPDAAELPLSFVGSGDSRPLRDRWHLDVVRPGDVVAAVAPGPGGGPYGVRHADPDDNEVDLVPGDPLSGDASDWVAVFGTMACYRVDPAAQGALVTAAAAVADAAGYPLLVGVRPGLVVLDTGKDQGDAHAHGLDLDFAVVAAELQAVARGLGAVADASAPCFVQTFLDAADVAAVRAFWLAALGYVADRREGLTDIHDPRRLGPVLVLQELDADETDRRRQRNRIHLELTVPADVAASRVAVALAAGGHVVGESRGRTTLVDPEGNELVVVAGS